MCMMIAAIGLSIAQAAVGFGQAKQQADEQNEYYEQNRKASIVAGTDRYAPLPNNILQKRQSAAAALSQQRIEALNAKAKGTVAAGEGGVSGLSVDALLGDLDAQHGRQILAIKRNYQIEKENSQDEGKAALNNTISRINSVRQASNPSPLPFIVQGLSGALGAIK